MNTEGDSHEPDGHEEELYDAPGLGEPALDAFINLSDPTLTSFDTPEGAGDDGDEAYLPRLVNDVARYAGFLRVGKGGSGLVRSCRDPHLGRIVAIKTLHPHLSTSAFHRSRFIQEARIMAQLEHPNVVPVHELGVDEKEASVYFTMKRVEGATLLQVVKALHEKADEYTERFSPARLLDVFFQICQAVAFAHSKGVLHRDLKPENILLGSFGEVLVMDWGLAKVQGEEEPQGRLDLSGVEEADATLPGTVSGTPLNMSPEQAMGDIAAVDERSDVFSLGGLLYHILTLERPFGGKDVIEILHNVIHEDPPSPRQRTPDRGIARELDAICMKALSKRREDRFQTLAEMIDELQRYREGRPVACCPDSPAQRAWKWCRRHPVISSTATAAIAALVLGLTAVELANFLRYGDLTRRGDFHLGEGTSIVDAQFALLESLRSQQEANPYKKPKQEEVATRELLEKKVDESTDHFEDAAMLYLLATADKLTPRVRGAIVDIHKQRIRYAREAGLFGEVDSLLRIPRRYLGPGFAGASEEDREFLLDAEQYVKGEGSLQLRTEPAGGGARLYELTDDSGVLKRGAAEDLDTATTQPIPLPKGSYEVTLQAGDGTEVVFPVFIEHAEAEQATVVLPGEVPEGMVYIPAGPFYAGGEAARSHRIHAVYLPGFFMRATEVTFAEYLAYWLAEDGADRAPRDMARVRLEHEDRVYRDAWDATGRHLLEAFEMNGPVVGITQAAAARYCAWRGAREGRVCRLPTSQQWEKAARGVDAREFVWGNGTNDTFALISETPEAVRPGKPFARPGTFTNDCSVYKVFDLGGNVREWTSTPFGPEERGFFLVKGASAATTRRFLYSSYSSDTAVVPTDIGFRYVFELEESGSGGR